MAKTFNVIKRNWIFTIFSGTIAFNDDNSITFGKYKLTKDNIVSISNPTYGFWGGQHGFIIKFYDAKGKTNVVDIYPNSFRGIMDKDKTLEMQEEISKFASENQIALNNDKVNNTSYVYNSEIAIIYIGMLIFNIAIAGGYLSFLIGLLLMNFLYKKLEVQIGKTRSLFILIGLWLVMSLFIAVVGFYIIQSNLKN